MKCRNCSADISISANFCAQCGARNSTNGDKRGAENAVEKGLAFAKAAEELPKFVALLKGYVQILLGTEPEIKHEAEHLAFRTKKHLAIDDLLKELWVLRYVFLHLWFFEVRIPKSQSDVDDNLLVIKWACKLALKDNNKSGNLPWLEDGFVEYAGSKELRFSELEEIKSHILEKVSEKIPLIAFQCTGGRLGGDLFEGVEELIMATIQKDKKSLFMEDSRALTPEETELIQGTLGLTHETVEQSDVQAKSAQSFDGAMAAYDRADYATAAKLFRPLADRSDAWAQCCLGVMHEHGQGVPQNYEEATKWYRLAADQGIAQAQLNLGYMYANGHGVAQDYKEALEWFRLAADQDITQAQFNLGAMYEDGKGVAQNYEEAVKWYRIAADQGKASAQFNLGLLYANGRGVKQDYREAVKLFSAAADQGLAQSQTSLGYMYEHGQGVAQDRQKAVEWYRKAAEQGDAQAQRNLRIMSERG